MFDLGSKRAIFFLGLLLLCLLVLIDLSVGSVKIPFQEIWKILLGEESESRAWEKILWEIRLPKTFTAIIVGAGLSVSGLQMQNLFRNPLAGPSVLGITAGASIGVASVVLLGGGAISIQAISSLEIGGAWLTITAAILGATLVMILILALSYKVKDHVALLIVGVMVGQITSALISVWQYFSAPEQIQNYLMWTFGSLGGVTSNQLWIMALLVFVGLILAISQLKGMNMMLLGERYAESMGLDVKKFRMVIIASSSIMAGTITGFCGPIGFIGVAIPHLVRNVLQTSDHWKLLPGSILAGSIVMLFCDLVADWPGAGTGLPINAVTSLIGAPVIIWVILKQRNAGKSI